MPRVCGLDVSANRIAWALCDGAGECDTDYIRRDTDTLGVFVEVGVDMIRDAMKEGGAEASCIEINLHPKIMHKGHPSANLIRAYLRSRWVEGAVLSRLFECEPLEIQKIKGGFHKIPAGNVFALQASGGKDAKLRRRERMTLHYNLQAAKISEDEIDALAVAHECAVALTTGIRGAAAERGCHAGKNPCPSPGGRPQSCTRCVYYGTDESVGRPRASKRRGGK